MNLSKQIIAGNITALSKGITLLESTLESDEHKARKLVTDCFAESGNSIRIGITGVPGVGKSTFIETFGKLLTSKGKKVAVLAVDPTSDKTHGSILGDKSRMHELSTDKNAFIRPSPNKGTLGGVTNKTQDSIVLCEAAGFNIILIETVGVGQSETTVSNLVDFFLLLMLAGAGDELQGIKRGIMELADALIITKSDGENIQNAKNACLEYKRALHMFPEPTNGWTPQVGICSAIENSGITKIYDIVEKFNFQMLANGWKDENREKQKIFWLHQTIKEEYGKKKYQNLIKHKRIKEFEKQIKNGENMYEILLKIDN